MQYLNLEEYIIFTHRTEEQYITTSLTGLFQISIQQKLEYPFYI